MTRIPRRLVERAATVPMETAVASYAIATSVLNAFGFGVTWHMLIATAPLWLAHFLGGALGIGGVLTLFGVIEARREIEVGGLVILGSSYAVRLLAAVFGHGWWWPEFAPTYAFNISVAIACFVRARQLLKGDTLVRARPI